jgi:DNA-binding FadR family transcriptional regulator
MSPGGRLHAALKEHVSIATAIEAGDPAAARQSMRRHLDTTSALLESLAKKQPGLFSLQANPS